jgi:hypothetical protein
MTDSDSSGGIAVPSRYVGHLSGEVFGGAMTLPEKVVVQLRAVQEQVVGVGEIWWLPEELAKYPGGKDRFCLVVALERPLGDPTKTPLVHFVAGSTNGSASKTIMVAAGTSGLNQDTYFRFWWSGSVAGSDLAANGKLRGSLPVDRLPDIEAAIRASTLGILKRLRP